MIPSIPRWTIRLNAPILNRHPIKNPMLQHRNPIQPPHLLAAVLRSRRLPPFQPVGGGEPAVVDEAECFASVVHAVVLFLELVGAGAAEVGLVEGPGAGDCPVAEGTGAGIGE